MSIIDIITIIIAVWGAALSTSLVISRRSRLEVNHSLSHFHDSDDELSEPCITIKAIKKGTGNMYISGWGFLHKDKNRYHIRKPYPNTKLPLELKEGENHIFGYSCRKIDEDIINQLYSLDNIKFVYVQDATGKFWKRRIKKEHFDQYLSGNREGWKINQGVASGVISRRLE